MESMPPLCSLPIWLGAPVWCRASKRARRLPGHIREIPVIVKNASHSGARVRMMVVGGVCGRREETTQFVRGKNGGVQTPEANTAGQCEVRACQAWLVGAGILLSHFGRRQRPASLLQHLTTNNRESKPPWMGVVKSPPPRPVATCTALERFCGPGPVDVVQTISLHNPGNVSHLDGCV